MNNKMIIRIELHKNWKMNEYEYEYTLKWNEESAMKMMITKWEKALRWEEEDEEMEMEEERENDESNDCGLLYKTVIFSYFILTSTLRLGLHVALASTRVTMCCSSGQVEER